MDMWPILQEELVLYQNCTTTIRHCLCEYEKLCSELILSIGRKTFNECQGDFDNLFLIQQYLSMALFKYEFPLSGRVYDFVYYMDRDDPYARKYWHQKFQNGLEWPSEPEKINEAGS